MKKTIIIILSAFMAFSSTAIAADFAEATTLTEKQQKKAKKAKAEIKEVTFNVSLHCESCVKKAEENLAFEKGVKGLEVSLEKQAITFKFDSSKTSEQKLKAAIESLGFKVTEGCACGHEHHHHN